MLQTIYLLYQWETCIEIEQLVNQKAEVEVEAEAKVDIDLLVRLIGNKIIIKIWMNQALNNHNKLVFQK